jgi:heptosyltransferase-3
MGTILEQLPSGARVAVIRLRSLGDCVLTTPAPEVLRRNRPDLRVTVVVEERFKPIFEGNPDLDALVAPSLRELVTQAEAPAPRAPYAVLHPVTLAALKRPRVAA